MKYKGYTPVGWAEQSEAQQLAGERNMLVAALRSQYAQPNLRSSILNL